MSANFVSNQEIIVAAHQNLNQNVWDYLTGATESETTLRRNRMGLDSIAFRPRVLIDVSEIDTSCFQLLMQAQIACHDNDKQLNFVSISPAIREVMELFGLENYLNEPETSTSSWCPWIALSGVERE